MSQAAPRSNATDNENVEMVNLTGDPPVARSNAGAGKAADVAADDDDDDDEDEEYEIEDILGHELKNGQYRYLVSWAGYGPEHNSWTLERDFGSTEIIDDYWSKQGGRPAPSSTSKSKKRAASASQTNNSKRTGSSQPQQNKKADRDGQRARAEREEAELERLAQEHQDPVSQYKDLANWEDSVQKISTVERGPNNRLVVYMIMKDGSKTAQDSSVANARCPQKMLEFYESHLKWRHVK
ncbi:hypothetical protein NliqN6_6719 [Naganishia liquefaciens]|uniref:Chromo domain-containing protein n=1 Tax=Naganishia liquefaciens TaxID=104408 RepID=A0A8H3U087_9TREE|nr:hypothetical protein NliqN6_6719 [Naganishia liquefaciens]